MNIYAILSYYCCYCCYNKSLDNESSYLNKHILEDIDIDFSVIYAKKLSCDN